MQNIKCVYCFFNFIKENCNYFLFCLLTLLKKITFALAANIFAFFAKQNKIIILSNYANNIKIFIMPIINLKFSFAINKLKQNSELYIFIII